MTIEADNQQSLHDVLYQRANQYLKSTKLNNQGNLHEIYLSEVEQPLLEAVMSQTKYNQVRAAKMLGISRGTLRKKLKQHFDDKYVGTRDPE